ncbi:MAG: peptidoglycan DD-metalloendopeptidase family protein [Candidatus Magasanikbacteria bacterium]|jgi:murein DD-endopeptidase MepM/ murein hydrolase activator NlpD|nr:peptidoglycan DD-metalloendopeptidase family protein [Candidatus Magasanikbacteria bacterium]MBT4221332.1 peptidoglycan DD-metalloendopeptidase family protein [Candidatus Magasanikbacteria bacterium]MBT4350820.1 peptidoglycan DD-metalloendopeptidase family protein [Candidatus Magasanikbacteria bacterium]MBT4542180.1 peptidoglycan DD-metalloendopeptidase family protein [Candidatus Magasanikbacteria bacterium]MBT6253456.1 peptidoglycan DD-metalloendopeptidase family protein [Candidatus Magasan
MKFHTIFRIFIFVSLLASVFFGADFLYAEEVHNHDGVGGSKEQIEDLQSQIKENQDKRNQLEKTIAEYNKKRKQLQTESVSYNNQIAILDNRSAQIQIDIESTEHRLAELSLEIDALRLSITDKEQVIDKQQKILAELLRTIYQNDRQTLIEILATHDSLSTYHNQVQYVETVESDLGNSLRTVKDIKTQLEEEKVQTEGVRLAFTEVKADLEEKKKNFEEQAFLKDQLRRQTNASESQFTTLVGNLRQQYKSIEADIVSSEKQVRQLLEAENKIRKEPTVEDSGAFLWPVRSRYITARFHDVNYPYRHIFEHSGLDIGRVPQGSPLYASKSGYISRRTHCTSASCFGYIMVIHSGGFSTLYGHASKILVQEGQFVGAGDLIGYSGGTPGTVGAGPFVTGPHLHFEVRKNGIPVNPLTYLIRDY